MKYRLQTIDEFTAALGSNAPTPGGGGAAALCASLGAALSSMVCRVTKAKPNFKGDVKLCDDIIMRAEKLRDILLNEIDADADAFDFLMEAYRSPKSTDAEKEKRKALIQERLIFAAEAPLRAMRAVCETVDLLTALKDISSRDVISDVAVGASLCKAALSGASITVYINAALLTDAEKKAYYVNAADEMLGRYGEIADRLFTELKSLILN